MRSESTSATLCAIQDFRFIVLPQDLEGLGLRVSPRQGISRWIVAIVTQLSTNPLSSVSGAPIRALHFERQPVQVVGSEVWPEVRAVTVDGAVLHEAVREK